MATNNLITYEIYLECVKVGLIPNPLENDYCVCINIYCNNCPLNNTGPCQNNYRTASITYYPKTLIENPEYLL